MLQQTRQMCFQPDIFEHKDLHIFSLLLRNTNLYSKRFRLKLIKYNIILIQ